MDRIEDFVLLNLFLMMKLKKLEEISAKFVKSGEYAKLPTEAEVRKAEKEIAEAQEAAREKAADTGTDTEETISGEEKTAETQTSERESAEKADDEFLAAVRNALDHGIVVHEGDVALAVGCQDKGDGRDCGLRETGCPEYHVHECPSHAPIAVREGVNRFELSMCQGCCGYRRQLCGGKEPDEIVHETRNGFGNRRHVNGADWVDAIAPNPVLVDP